MNNSYGLTNNGKIFMTLQTQSAADSSNSKSNVDSNSSSAINNSSRVQKSVSCIKVRQNDFSDMTFKGENLQQISTNALPSYCPPPNYPKSEVPFESHCCSDCGDTFVLESSLKFHLERRSVLIKFDCESCKCFRTFYNRCTLLSHVRAHQDKKEISNIAKAVVSPLPRVLMDGLQTEFVNALDDELNSISDTDTTPPTELLEFSLNEVEEVTTVAKDKAANTSDGPKVKCFDCNEEFESAKARKEHLTNGDTIPILTSQCNKCGMVCPSKCSLKAHQRIHLQISPYVCPECGDSPDVYWANFQHHVKFKCFHQARSIGYKCPVCKRVSPSKESLLKHMELHTERYLKCELCPRAYMCSKTFEEHNDIHHAGRKPKYNTIYKCSLCDIVFLSGDQMLAHRSTHLKEQICEYVFNCMQCGKSLESKASLLEHIRTAHQKIYRHIFNEETTESKPPQSTVTYRGKVECILCHFTFHSFLGYSVHVSRAHINVNQPCSYCYMIIGNRKEMVIHGRKHLNKGNIVCLLCNNNKFHDDSSLDLHLQKHSKKLQFCSFCPLCETIMPSNSEALSHLRKEHLLEHLQDSSETPVEKNVPEVDITCQPCNYCYMIIGNMKEMVIHGRKHLNKGNIVCLLCNNKKFHDDSSLDLHLKKHSEKLQFDSICTLCEAVMPSNSEALNHLRKEHLLEHLQDSSCCHFCRAVFTSDEELQDHLQTTHSVNSQKRSSSVISEEAGQVCDGEILKKQRVEGNECAKCDYTSTERESFKKHLLTHKTNKSTFQCQECGLCFVVEPTLVKHLRIIHKISDTKKYIEEEGTNFMPELKKTAEVSACDSLICSVCFTTFANESSLKTHMRSHGMAFIQANKAIPAS